MGTSAANLAVRFLLELSALFLLGVWGWRKGEDAFRFVFALGIPLLAAVLWTTFAVPNDPTRSGAAPVRVPGLARLVLELGVFACATWALYDLGFAKLSALLGSAIGLHYVVSYDRVRWLIGQ